MKDRWGSNIVSSDPWMSLASSHGRVDHSRAPPGGCCAAALYNDWKVRNAKSMQRSASVVLKKCLLSATLAMVPIIGF